MTAIEHDHAIAIFQHLYATDVIHCRNVCHSFRVDGKDSVHRLNAACVVVVKMMERLDQRAAVWFHDIM